MYKPLYPLKRIAFWLFNAIVAFILIADALAKPVYKPLISWAANLKVLAALEAQIKTMPRFAVLLLFAVPFAFAEPLKLYALVLMAGGHFIFRTGPTDLLLPCYVHSR